ncbi:MAG: phosphatidylinositol-specific phospholipase C [Dysgonomonas sp.]|nr:phosphatidylinositol-specific phospholipase C [Dysgonomonas sp.]
MASRESYLRIVNLTKHAMTVNVSSVENNDWDGISRPDRNFNNVTIEPFSSLRHREELNYWARSAWYNMYFCFENGDKIGIRNDQLDSMKWLQRLYPVEEKDAEKYVIFQNNINSRENTFYITSKYWCKDLSNDLYLYNLTIPGTHDTCATHALPFAKCQNLGLKEQLDLGIRFIDIRCRHMNDRFAIHHGSVYQKLNFRDILDECMDFLKRSKEKNNGENSEFIIFSVKEEYDGTDNTRSFEETLINKYLVERPTEFFYIKRTIPQVKDIRGKIVLLSRYKNNTIGINATPWADNTSFEINNTANLYVQDRYQLTPFENKWTDIRWCLDKATLSNHEATLFLNYCSGIQPPSEPKVLAHNINNTLFSYVSKEEKKRLGVLVMDFPETCEALTRSIVCLNFK